MASLALLVALLAGATMPHAAVAAEFLRPEEAFRVTAALSAADRVSVDVAIAPNHYVYREPLRFSADGVALGAPQVPAGKVKFDENFGRNVETYRDRLRVELPLTAAPSGAFAVDVTTQGCADAGLCYPPQTVRVRLDPATAGAVVAGAPLDAATPAPSAGVAGALTARSPPSTPALASPAAGPSPAASALESTGDAALRRGGFWPVVGVFFGLGVLLAFTPCVLPMVPILSSLIVGSADASRRRALALAVAYSAGMALVYTALGVAAGLAGEGFGAALQSPAALVAFAALLVALALAMLDVWELRLPGALATRLTERSNRLPGGRLAGVFAMGGLSALIVSPCVSAPLAAALLYIGKSRDVALGGSALAAMSVGMSVPLLALGASAGHWLPRAGPWMQTVKRVFGVLMLGVALWVAQPLVAPSAALLLWGVLLLLLGFLLMPAPRGPGGAHHGGHAMRDAAARTAGSLALAWGLLQVVGAASGADDPLRPLGRLVAGGASAGAAADGPAFRTIRTSAELDDALRAATVAGRPLVLDFWADWCVACKEMERETYPEPAIARRLAAAVLLKADVTADGAESRALLRRFELFGPPATLFFDRTGQERPAARAIGFQKPDAFARTLDVAGL